MAFYDTFMYVYTIKIFPRCHFHIFFMYGRDISLDFVIICMVFLLTYLTLLNFT